MQISKVKIGGTWCKQYLSNTPTTNWLIHLSGIGEMGNPDGSQIDLVEAHGYPQAAKAGFEFPFNIIAPQIPTKAFNPYSDFYIISGSDVNKNSGWFVNHIVEVLGAKSLGVTGISLGGRGVWQLLKYDPKKYIKFIAPVCGFYQTDNIENIPVETLRDLPGYSWHHQNDTTMSYIEDKKQVEKYNASTLQSRTPQVIDGIMRPAHFLNTLTFSTTDPHNAWDTAYKTSAGKDSLLTWIKQQFVGMVVTPPVEPIKEAIKEQYIENGKLVTVGVNGTKLIQ